MKSENTIFYAIESVIKSYRKFAQANLKKVCPTITIDQGLVLNKLLEQPDIRQTDLAKSIFKDNASLSRMLDLLEKNEFITRTINPENRRRFLIRVTKKGKETIKKLDPIVFNNREKALQDITESELFQVEKTLSKILKNLNS